MWAIPDRGQIQDFGNAELRQYPSTILFRLGILSPLCLPRVDGSHVRGSKGSLRQLTYFLASSRP